MPTYGIVDDKADTRESMERNLSLEFESRNMENWKVICIEPFIETKDYISWIKEHDVALVIIDERLNEQGDVRYKGSEIISFLRSNFKELPIISFSSYSDQIRDEETILFDYVTDKNHFINKYFDRSLRAAQRYWTTYQNELSAISSISKKLALGQASEDEIVELKSLQTKLMIPGLTEQIINKTEWLEKFEQSITKFANVTQKLSSLIDKRKE